MERHQVERLARQAWDHWVEELPLESFTMELRVESGDDDLRGSCSMTAENRDVLIRINPDNCLTAKHVQETVKHELLHALTCEYQLFWELVKPDMPDDKQEAAERLWRAMWEQMLRRLERVWPEEE